MRAVPQYLACNATFFNFTLITPDQEGHGTITLFITLKGGSKLNNFTLNSDEGFIPGKHVIIIIITNSMQFLLITIVKKQVAIPCFWIGCGCIGRLKTLCGCV